MEDALGAERDHPAFEPDLPAERGLEADLPADLASGPQGLVDDRDDMVQKGYGWMLKEASKPHQPEVFDDVMAHRAVMPRTALRYAIEKMPAELRRKAMER